MKKVNALVLLVLVPAALCIITVPVILGLNIVLADSQDLAPSSQCTYGSSWANSSYIFLNLVADDDYGLSSVGLYFRYSQDNNTWQDWTVCLGYSSLTSTHWEYQCYFEFSHSGHGEGYYQFYTCAQDNIGQTEDPPSTPDVNVCYDITPPQNPASSASEAHGILNDQWQTIVSTPSFTWEAPVDNLSGVKNYDYYWGPEEQTIPAFGTCEGSFTSEQLIEGSFYYLKIRAKDYAGNCSGWVQVFTFKYGPVYVDDDWAGLNPGDSTGTHILGKDAYAKIQDAIDAIAPKGAVWVAGGYYSGNISILGKPSEYKKTISLKGGYSPDFLNRDPVVYPSTIDALGTENTILLNNGDESSIDGLIITGSNLSGAGIYIDNSDNVTIQNNIIQANEGIGIRLQVSGGCSITNNLILNNDTGIYLGDSEVAIVSYNEIQENGLGIYNYSTSVLIR